MHYNTWYSKSRKFLALTGAVAMLISSGCGNQSQTPVSATANDIAVNKDGLPLSGKLQAPTPPAKAVFGMIYHNTNDGSDYIYDGRQWVPHDGSVDKFYMTAPSQKVAAAAVSMASLNGGAHDQHAAYDCEACHRVDWANGLGLVWFDNPNSPAIGTGMPAPVFNEANATCSNIACHSMPTGMTFSYYFPDGTGQPVLNTVNINSNPAAATPNWFSTGAGCAACHGNPPVNGSSGSNLWHSGQHATSIPGANECQFCHPDASSPNNGIGDTITNQSLHANGVINVQATFKSACFSCH
ncbi:MAG: cytochrome C [Geobacter sp.]|nr:MAG: cytochrome C [Geobacter sp.]